MKKSCAFLLAIFLLTTAFTCNKTPAENLQAEPPIQKFTPMTTDNYPAAWKTVDSLERQGLLKSALEKTEAIYARAKADKNFPQIVKSVIYRSKFVSATEEEGMAVVMQQWEEEIEEADAPTRQILQSVYAEIIDGYRRNNQWRINNRTETQNFDNQDIKTWSAAQYTDYTSRLHLSALEKPALLQQVDLGDLSAIVKDENTTNLRPTLYDLLAHRALDYFMNEQNHLTQPAYKFELRDPAVFAYANEFVNTEFTTRDTASFKKKTLDIFQDLLQFRMQQNNTDALADADLKRVKFVYENAVMPDKTALYKAALKKMYATYEAEPTAGEILFNLGVLQMQKGNAYDKNNPETNDEAHKNGLVTALKTFREVSEKYPNTPGASLAVQQINNLTSKQFALQTERVNVSGQPFLAQLSYKNAENVAVKVIAWNQDRQDKLEKIRRDDNRSWQPLAEFLNDFSAVQNETYNLAGTQDLREHTTEIAFETLPYGDYLIVAGSDADFKLQNDFIGYVRTTVSDLGYWAMNADGQERKKAEFTAFHRKTGAPVGGVKVEFYTDNYNSVLRKNQYKKVSETQTDADGYFKSSVPTGNNRRYNNNSFRVKLTQGDDVLFLDENYVDSEYPDRRNVSYTVQFFTDRAIYRPGQTVYFKGLRLNFDNKNMPAPAANQTVSVNFMDANYQKITSADFTTNEYGTFNGTFTAPQGGLLGNMTLQTSHGSKSIRVEEYKRPKFEVKFDTLDVSFALNETIEIKGKAAAYAGNNIDGAQVTYRVTREARFPYLPWWYRSRLPASPAMEIANGTTQTDAEGKFTVDFKAIPDPDIAAKDKPIFTYKITADVTDLTGETRTCTQRISVGYTALEISAQLPAEAEAQDLQRIDLSTRNLNGDFTAAQGKFELKLLDAPEKVYVSRYWETPDNPLLSKAEFTQKFPHLPYQNENEPQNWEVKRTAFSADFDTNKSKFIDLSGLTLAPGVYRAEMKTQDKNGIDIEWEQLVTVYDLTKNELPVPQVGQHFRKDKSYEPGESVAATFGTSERDLKVLFHVIKDKKIVSRKWLTINGIDKEIMQVAESDRGNFHYAYNYARHNRSFNRVSTVKVPWSNKDLTIAYTTFRDKLLPGQDEEWQLKISGPKGGKVAAEMLATMYDASLDAFAANSFSLSPFPMNNYANFRMDGAGFSADRLRKYEENWQENLSLDYAGRTYPGLNLFGFSLYERIIRETVFMDAMVEEESVLAGSPRRKAMSSSRTASPPPPPSAAPRAAMGMSADAEADTIEREEQTENAASEPAAEAPQTPAVRENLNETVFFYPDLMTDKEGNIIVKFKMNEALTRWKFLGLAHTKDLQSAVTEKEIVTQKDLMVVPNAPRFFRENDKIEFTAKVVNLSDKELSGEAKLNLVNPLNGKPVFTDKTFTQSYTVAAGQSARVAWYFDVPEVSKVAVIEHTTSATAGNFSDAERSVTPVLTNRMLVTETMPLPVRGGETQTFTFKSMQEKMTSPTLANEGLTLEFTSNPAWYAVQALPYLMEYPYECTEQIFSRYYANSLATSVANSHPKVKTIFEQWRDREPDALLSNLSKNQELKTALLEETPWVLNAQSEAQQKRNIGLLFDLNKMANEQTAALRKLRERQMPGGGFPWFPGGRDDWYITQYLVESLGHLDKLGVADVTENTQTWQMVKDAVNYCDSRAVEHYEKLEEKAKDGKLKLEDDNLSAMLIHYLYARSFFLEDNNAQANTGKSNLAKTKKYLKLNGKAQDVYDYCVGQADKYWLDKNIYHQGMIALSLHRLGKGETPAKLVKSFKERAINNPELGMYFKGETGYNWYQLPVERHSLLMEVMNDVADDQKAVEDMKTWLLKNKQTNHWRTTKATASAVYALLATGDNWLLETEAVDINLPALSDNSFKKQIDTAQQNAEAGTGYFKTRIDGEKVKKSMAMIEVSNPNKSVAWGAVYWQYFEQLDKITSFEDTPLQIKKQLFKVKLTDTGEKITPVNAGDALNPGEKLKVRIELRVDRPMDYVHMKDGRASGFEPLNVLSQYKYQGGLGYYESTRDASTDFFFANLPKGTHVFEYPLRVVHKGDFSNGVTTVQCMYAPEFSSHSEGVRVEVE